MQHAKEKIKSMFTNVEPEPIKRLTGFQGSDSAFNCSAFWSQRKYTRVKYLVIT